MLWYLLNIFILTVVWFLPTDSKFIISDSKECMKIRKKRLCIAATVNWILLSGLRSLSVGPDTYNYLVNSFIPVKEMSWNEVLRLFPERYLYGQSVLDPGYCLLTKIFQIFSGNYQVWLFFIAVVFTVPLGVIIYRFSSNPYLSYILYSTLFYNFFSVTGHRQTLATAIVFGIGLFAALKRRFFIFLFSLLVACTIHPSAIAFLPVYFLAKVRLRKNQLIFCFSAIALSYIFRNQLLSILKSITGYNSFGQVPQAGAGAFIILLLSFAVLISIFYNRTVDLAETETGIIHLSYNALLTACFFSSLLLINPVFMRVLQYYSLLLLILLPEGARIFGKGKGRMFYGLCCTLLMLALFVSEKRFYEFFWQ